MDLYFAPRKLRAQQSIDEYFWHRGSPASSCWYFLQWSYSFFFFFSEVVARVSLCGCVHSCWPLLHSMLWERVTNFPVMPLFAFLFCIFFSFVDLFVDLFTFYYLLRTCMSCLHCLCCLRFSPIIAVFFVIPFFFFLSTPLVYHSGPCFLHSLLSVPWIFPCVGPMGQKIYFWTPRYQLTDWCHFSLRCRFMLLLLSSIILRALAFTSVVDRKASLSCSFSCFLVAGGIAAAISRQLSVYLYQPPFCNFWRHQVFSVLQQPCNALAHGFNSNIVSLGSYLGHQLSCA